MSPSDGLGSGPWSHPVGGTRTLCRAGTSPGCCAMSAPGIHCKHRSALLSWILAGGELRCLLRSHFVRTQRVSGWEKEKEKKHEQAAAPARAGCCLLAAAGRALIMLVNSCCVLPWQAASQLNAGICYTRPRAAEFHVGKQGSLSSATTPLSPTASHRGQGLNQHTKVGRMEQIGAKSLGIAVCHNGIFGTQRCCFIAAHTELDKSGIPLSKSCSPDVRETFCVAHKPAEVAPAQT